jgi:hypothetical protein
MYGISYMFWHYITILRERSSCLLRDAQLRSSRQNIVDGRKVSSDVVESPFQWTKHAHPQYFIDCSIEHLSEGTRNAP